MKLYLAWYSTGKKHFTKLNKQTLESVGFLESFLTYKKKGLENEYNRYKKKFFLDSWAFTAYTQWEKISINKYINFIKENKQYLQVYANLDVIWDPGQTKKNQKIMEENWLSPLPTYHYWSDVKFLKYYLKNYKYIWIGWLVPHSTTPKKIKKCLDYVFYYIKKNKLKTKVHWWGMTNPTLIKRYPLYSVDSTGWLAWWKFKRLFFYKDWKLISKWADKMRKENWVDFWKKHYSDLNMHNIQEIYKYVKYITKLQKAKGIIYWNK